MEQALFIGMGGPGCGIATSIVAWVNLGLTAGYLTLTPRYSHMRFFKHFGFIHPKTFRTLLALGLPMGAAIFLKPVYFVWLLSSLAHLGHFRLQPIKLRSLLAVCYLWFHCPISVALSIRIAAVMGMALTPQHVALIIYRRKLGFFLTSLLALCSMFFLWIARESIIRVYTSDAAVTHIASTLLLTAVVYALFDAWQVTAAGALRGMQTQKNHVYYVY